MGLRTFGVVVEERLRYSLQNTETVPLPSPDVTCFSCTVSVESIAIGGAVPCCQFVSLPHYDKTSLPIKIYSLDVKIYKTRRVR